VDGQQSEREKSESNGREKIQHVEIGKGDLRELTTGKLYIYPHSFYI